MTSPADPFFGSPNNVNIYVHHLNIFPTLLLLPLYTNTSSSEPFYRKPEIYGLLLNHKIRFPTLKKSTHKIAYAHILVVTA